MKRNTFRVLLVVGVLLGAGTVLAITTIPQDEQVSVQNGVPFNSPDGLTVKIWGSTNMSMTNLFPDSSTIQLNSTDGNISLAATGDTYAAVHTSNLTGTYTNVTNITAGSTWIEIYPSDKQRVDVRGDVDQISIRDITLDDGTEDFWIEGTDSGLGSVKLYTLPANSNVAAIDADTGAYLDSAATDANGNATLDIPLSSHSVELVEVDNPQSPTVSNADPTGPVSDNPQELSVDVNDADFPADDVQVTITLDGSQIHQENITSNSTVTTSNFASLDLGSHTWNVSAIDAYGNTETANYTFSLPTNITIRNESNASQIIAGSNITATFYSADGEIIVQRSDSDNDGNISLRGLPNTDFVVTFSGSGWYDRRAYLESIFEQQNVYLLNTTAYPDAIDTTFVYEDRTNSFPPDETTLKVQRAVNTTGGDQFEWETVAGDFWGAAGEFPFTGQYQTRYRLIIKNQVTNQSRILGTHIPTSDGIKNIIVGRIIFEAGNATGRYWDAGINTSTDNLQVYYQDPSGETSDLRITVYEQGNKSNEIFNQTFSGPLSQKMVQVALSDAQQDTNWVVTFEGEHPEDGTILGQLVVGNQSFPLPIDPDILATLALISITFIGTLYGPRTATMGAWAMIGITSVFMLFQWVTIPVAGLIVAVGIAAGTTFYREALP